MESIKHKLEETDPNILQRTASNPQESIWVGASAGTGKTKVLTDRVLRLLLPRADGNVGTPPNRILCLTFTKAAANEMALRINKTLSCWAVMDLEELSSTLENLLGHEPSGEQLGVAGRLFADVIDCAGGLQIMTIHSFCQSVLGRFPLEADLPPNFKLLDEVMAAEIMSRAQNDVFEKAQSSEYASSPLNAALHNLAAELDEDSFSSIIRGICSERHQLVNLFARYHGADGVYAAICEHYGINQGAGADDIIASICIDGSYDGANLRVVAMELAQDKGKHASARAANMLAWLNASFEGRQKLFHDYKSAFLTQKETMLKQAFPPSNIDKKYPEYKGILQKEANRLIDAIETMGLVKSAQMTRDLLIIGHEIFMRYSQIKKEKATLDFDDQILRTMELLKGETKVLAGLSDVAPWIMYKLDQGLDHILVDEAQDTNPEQWRIIESLCEEFFSGMSARDEVMRTSFTVGDIKQSIYSFQRAAPEEFKNMQGIFDRKIKDSGKVNREVALDISFRSTESILRVVDNVFKYEELNKAVGGGSIHHESFRAGQAGVVELWPLFETKKKEDRDFWNAPIEVKSQQSASSELASYIAQNIRNWLDRKEMLPAYNRPIGAGDIMILVRSRSAFVDQMVKALKALDVPVSGADRMKLGDQLAVQDLLAMARFCLLPDDDLTLAEVLKSPLLGWNEDELFSLSYNRKGTLWQELCNFDYDKIASITGHDKTVLCADNQKRDNARDYLSRLMGRARYLGAYEFFSHILNMKCPANEHSGLKAIRSRLGDDALDPIDEFLNAAMAFSHDDTDHLQIFLDQMERKNIEIKREMDEGGGQVRIMTIHGSKGLQAPIVIMPDTIKSSAAKKTGRMLWMNKTGLNMPIYSARKDDDPKSYKEIYDACSARDEEEYYRLLYVAMTRAADRLYIAGHQGSKGAKDSSWYFKIRAAMENDESCIELEDGLLRIENPQEAKPDKAAAVTLSDKEIAALPDWALELAPDEPNPPRPLVPSAPSIEDRAAALSPLKSLDNKRFRRGNITHKLLQFLPDFVEGKREDAALKFVHKNAADLSEEIRLEIVYEVMKIFSNPEYAPFFSSNSMAEVSVTGLMQDNRIVSGQIDRLVIGSDEIWIVDYKTNRPPPNDVKDVPQIYYKQLVAYRDSIAEIYPNHKINCALLWTDGPRLMVLC